MKKEIICNCWGPIAYEEYKDHPVLWEDIYIQFEAKPGRKVYYFGPCLIGRRSFLDDMEIVNNICNKKPTDYWEEELIRNNGLLARLDSKELTKDKYIIEDFDSTQNIPDIYTSDDYITRQIAEDMIEWYLNTKGFNYQWNFVWKRPKVMVISS